MADITLVQNQEDVFTLSAADSATPPNPRPAGFSAQVAPYATAYVALTGGNTIHVVPKGIGDFSVTINGHSQDGTPLPSVTITYTSTAVPVPQATHFVVGDHTQRGQDIITPPDPGTDTVTGNV